MNRSGVSIIERLCTRSTQDDVGDLVASVEFALPTVNETFSKRRDINFCVSHFVKCGVRTNSYDQVRILVIYGIATIRTTSSLYNLSSTLTFFFI